MNTKNLHASPCRALLELLLLHPRPCGQQANLPCSARPTRATAAMSTPCDWPLLLSSLALTACTRDTPAPRRDRALPRGTAPCRPSPRPHLAHAIAASSAALPPRRSRPQHCRRLSSELATVRVDNELPQPTPSSSPHVLARRPRYPPRL